MKINNTALNYCEKGSQNIDDVVTSEQPISIYKRGKKAKGRCSHSKWWSLDGKKSSKVKTNNYKSINQRLNLEVIYRQQNKNCNLSISISGKSSLRTLMCVTVFTGPCSTSFIRIILFFGKKLVKFDFILDCLALLKKSKMNIVVDYIYTNFTHGRCKK